MRSLLIYFSFPLLLFAGVEVQAQETDFQINFNIAKQHLSQRRVLEALPYLEYLLENHPENANLKYLIGVCYAESEVVNPKTLELLEESTLHASLEYNPNSIDEIRTPIYSFYYLSVAYSQHRMCEEAEKARNKFVEIYPHEDNYYLEESEAWLKKCEQSKEKPKEEALPTFPDFEPYSSKLEEKVKQDKPLVSKPKKTVKDKKPKVDLPQQILTKQIEYSTEYPLYGVQLGAFKEAIPVSRFKKLKNVDAFMDKEGLIRYVVGHFSIHSQAMSLLKVIQEKGYQDAFIVNVNDARKFSEEVVSVNNVNIRASLSGKVSYAVQIGAFKKSIPDQTAEMYLKFEGIEVHQTSPFTILTLGRFDNYEAAKTRAKQVKASGLSDAFVIAFNNGKKISLKQAKDFK